MRKIGVAAIAFLLLWGITACTNAAAPSPNDLGEFRDVRVGYFSITTGEITDIVTYLSSTELSGRRSGTDGGMLAGDFIEKELATASVQPIGESYFQPFRFEEVKTGKRSLADVEKLQQLGWKITMQGRNVIGVLKGTTLEHEYVVIGAHYDHLGVQAGNLYPGADDNASGTAAVLEIAEAFGMLAQQGIIPQRSIVFVLFDAEEWGLWGSQYFVENSPVPIDDIVAMINLDMISRNKKTEVNVFGSPDIADFSQRSPRLSVALEKANNVLGFQLQYPAEEGRREQIFFRSDHASFFFSRPAGNRIPVVFFERRPSRRLSYATRHCW